jgi:putative ABC transport system ATP-binding protein
MSNPKIIFGDEPTGALNSKSAEEIMNIFSEINADGTAVMLVTHDAKVAARTERILFMSDGKIVSEMRLPKCSGTEVDDRVKKIATKMRELGI